MSNSELFNDKVNSQREYTLYTQMKLLQKNMSSKFKEDILQALHKDLEKIRIRFSNMSWIDRVFRLPPYNELKQEMAVIENKIRVWNKYERLNEK